MPLWKLQGKSTVEENISTEQTAETNWSWAEFTSVKGYQSGVCKQLERVKSQLCKNTSSPYRSKVKRKALIDSHMASDQRWNGQGGRCIRPRIALQITSNEKMWNIFELLINSPDQSLMISANLRVITSVLLQNDLMLLLQNIFSTKRTLNSDLGAISSMHSKIGSTFWPKIKVYPICTMWNTVSERIYENSYDLQAEDHTRIDLLYKI